MKLTKETLKQIIKEELDRVMNEGRQDREAFGRSYGSFRNDDLEFSQPNQTQTGADVGRAMAAAQKEKEELDGLESLNKRLHNYIIETLDNWNNWKAAVRKWDASDKSQQSFQNTIQTELSASALDSWVDKIVNKARADKPLVKKIVYKWADLQTAKYRAEIQAKKPKKSMMQRVGSFFGLNEELDAAPLNEASGKMILFQPGQDEFQIMLGNEGSITYLYRYAGNEAERMKQYLANLAGTNLKTAGTLHPKAARFIAQTLASQTNAKISPKELMQMSVQKF